MKPICQLIYTQMAFRCRIILLLHANPEITVWVTNAWTGLQDVFKREVELKTCISRKKKVRQVCGWYSKEMMRTELKYSPQLGQLYHVYCEYIG